MEPQDQGRRLSPGTFLLSTSTASVNAEHHDERTGAAMNFLDDLRAEWIAIRKSLGDHIAYLEAGNKIHPIDLIPMDLLGILFRAIDLNKVNRLILVGDPAVHRTYSFPTEDGTTDREGHDHPQSVPVARSLTSLLGSKRTRNAGNA
jgi:hypothetical protein